MIRTASILIFFLMLTTSTAYCCKCAGLAPLNILDYFDAGKIFRAKIIDIEYGYMNVITFKVEKGYKNVKDEDTIEVFTKDNAAACGWYAPELYDTWLVFMDDKDEIKEGFRMGWRHPYDLPIFRDNFVSQCDRLLRSDSALFIPYLNFLDDVINSCDGYNQFYYPGTNIKCGEGVIRNGKPDGKWMFYYLDGQEMTLGYYKNGLRDSTWYIGWYFTKGYDDEHHRCGLLYTTAYHNGKILFDGILDSEQKASSDTIIEKNFYDNGYIRSEEAYSRTNRKVYKLITYYENGNIESLDSCQIYKEFDENGSLLRHIDYKHNKRIYPIVEKYDDIRNKIKSCADSILVSYFGKCFFERHIGFNSKFSSKYVDRQEERVSSEWFKPIESLPEKYELVYNVIFNDSLKFKTIKLTIDKNYNPVEIEDIMGVQLDTKKPVFGCDTFIDYHKAKTIAKDYGFICDTIPYRIIFRWKKNIHNYYHNEEPGKKMLSPKMITSGRYFWHVMYLVDKRTSDYGSIFIDPLDGTISDDIKDQTDYNEIEE